MRNLEPHSGTLKVWCVSAQAFCSQKFRFGKRGLLEKGSFQKSPNFLEILENLEILEKLQTVENKGDSDHFLEILENLEILEIPLVKRPLS